MLRCLWKIGGFVYTGSSLVNTSKKCGGFPFKAKPFCILWIGEILEYRIELSSTLPSDLGTITCLLKCYQKKGAC